jgi:DNA-binding MarR family transcriptional regulator
MTSTRPASSPATGAEHDSAHDIGAEHNSAHDISAEHDSSNDIGAEHNSAAQAWRAMRTLVFDLHDRRAQVSEALELSFIRAKALGRLVRGPLTMRELAGQLAIDAPYTTVVVDDLERRGLVQRSTSPDDRRVKIVTITQAGARAAGIADQILSEPPPALAALDPAELAQLNRVLSRLIAAAQD